MLRAMTCIMGLTGGIGTGKSTVTKILNELGATTIDADAIVHELQAPGQPMLRTLAEEAGASGRAGRGEGSPVATDRGA